MTNATEKRIKTNINYLNESQLRKYLASEAISLGRGGIKEVSTISGVHRNTISAGIKELQSSFYSSSEKADSLTRVRIEGGGRKSITATQPGILEDLDRLVDPESYGNPENPLRWTTKSTRHLADELQKLGYKIQRDKVGDLLKELGFSLQQNKKMKQAGKESPDHDSQFRHINTTSLDYLDAEEPVISIDCKKKENIGSFKNSGAEYAPAGKPIEVLDHDFPLSEKKCRAIWCV